MQSSNQEEKVRKLFEKHAIEYAKMVIDHNPEIYQLISNSNSVSEFLRDFEFGYPQDYNGIMKKESFPELKRELLKEQKTELQNARKNKNTKSKNTKSKKDASKGSSNINAIKFYDDDDNDRAVQLAIANSLKDMEMKQAKANSLKEQNNKEVGTVKPQSEQPSSGWDWNVILGSIKSAATACWDGMCSVANKIGKGLKSFGNGVKSIFTSSSEKLERKVENETSDLIVENPLGLYELRDKTENKEHFNSKIDRASEIVQNIVQNKEGSPNYNNLLNGDSNERYMVKD